MKDFIQLFTFTHLTHFQISLYLVISNLFSVSISLFYFLFVRFHISVRSYQFSSVQFSCSVWPHELQHWYYFSISTWLSGNSDRPYFWGSKITADGDCSHEFKRHLLLGRKAMTNLDSILKSRDITLPTKVLLVKAMGFPVVMYGCESWTIKKAEHQRINAFELWCCRRLWEPLGLQGDPTSPS